MLSEEYLRQINERRRFENKLALSRQEAEEAERRRRQSSDSQFDITAYLIGYNTGIAYNTSSIIGAAASPVYSRSDYSSPSSSSSSYDSGSSSSDNSSSSSSFD